VLHRLAKIAVHEQRALPRLREGDRKVAGGGGLSIAAGWGGDQHRA